MCLNGGRITNAQIAFYGLHVFLRKFRNTPLLRLFFLSVFFFFFRLWKKLRCTYSSRRGMRSQRGLSETLDGHLRSSGRISFDAVYPHNLNRGARPFSPAGQSASTKLELSGQQAGRRAAYFNKLLFGCDPSPFSLLRHTWGGICF